ncbi:hypothetical protein [Duganella sp. Root1480D1]|uniref:hypothetical protein n=1 Tax=Duganella sp. Root1480D1 TaxID=1736471 RepID=UPI0007110687|nr:hypothetical protein [Duganella sp. Root1480D1]KQZ39685.1 hypothetical protein ASD58_04650 [Duganella sp. Root1480D1]
MGHGNYSFSAHAALVADRASASRSQVFQQNSCHPLMNPKGIKMRESRDNADHPNSLGIVFALDVTGSMGDIPEQLATKELPTFMRLLTACGVADPQIQFMAIGDATCDDAPLQVGQFESTAELMDQWLTWSYIEGGGGGSSEESYELAFYMAAQHTDLDCWVKRRKKGYLFLTGDELPYPAISRHQIETLVGDRLDEDLPIKEVIAAASETFHLFFLIPDLHRRQRCEARWRELLGDHVICMEAPQDACAVAASIVALTEGALPKLDALPGVLSGEGIDGSRVSAIVRSLRPYAALLEGGTAHEIPVSSPAVALGERPWWRRLFG